MTDGIAFNRIADLVRDQGMRYRFSGGALRVQGICHGGDAEDTVAIRRGNNGALVVYCHKCKGNAEFLDALGLTKADLHDEPLPKQDRRQRPANDLWIPCRDRGHKRIDQYLYLDEVRAIEHGVTRCDRKCFAQWRPDDTAKSGRRWSLNDRKGKRLVRLLPYRLPELIEAVTAERVIWIAEGERDVHALVDHGLPATCNAGGAGKWTAEHAKFLKDADISIVADRDEAGEKHAKAVVETLRGIARSVYVYQAASGKDPADHFGAGLNDTQFLQVWAPIPFPGDPAVSG